MKDGLPFYRISGYSISLSLIKVFHDRMENVHLVTFALQTASGEYVLI